MLITLRLALAATLFALSVTAEAHAKTAYLECTRPDFPIKVSMGISVDYDARTVVYSYSNIENGAPKMDANGVSAHPAQISDAAIVWKVVTRRADGKFYAEHFTLSRYTGELSEYDDGMREGESWTCKLAAAPPPRSKKF